MTSLSTTPMCDLTTSPRLIRCAYRLKKVLRENTELAEEIDASSRHLISQITKSIQCPIFGSPDPPASKKELDKDLKFLATSMLLVPVAASPPPPRAAPEPLQLPVEFRSELKELNEDLVTNSIKKILPNQLSEALTSLMPQHVLRNSQLQNARSSHLLDLRAPSAPQYYPRNQLLLSLLDLPASHLALKAGGNIPRPLSTDCSPLFYSSHLQNSMTLVSIVRSYSLQPPDIAFSFKPKEIFPQ